MPASEHYQYLGTIFGHQLGRSAANLGSIAAVLTDGVWVYTAIDRSHQDRRHDSEIAAITWCARGQGEFYSFSIERTFMPEESVPEGRAIVTTKPV